MAAPFRLSIAVMLISVIFVGFRDLMTNFEDNGCEMTYMFEYPEYRKVDLGDAVKDYPFYGLYIYGEGAYANRIRNLHLTGVPVLFIPGNAGSYKQVRSLGSVALRMSERQGVKTHFNYFVVDFNEELSGIYGGVLAHQTEFVHQCVKKILSLYAKSKSPPSSVVLVGHSMGGMIARALFTLPEFDPSLVNTIITQATPHQRPVADVDIHLQEFYTRVNKYWRDHAATTLRHVTVVSSGGSYRDIQVRYALTTLHEIIPDDRVVSVSTTSVPKAWVSTDHLCAVWCRQMVLLTKRALFDIIDPSTQQVTTDADLRMRVFRHHFQSHSGLPDYLTRDENKTITIDKGLTWEIKDARLWKFSKREMKSGMAFAVPLIVEEGKDALLITSNVSNPDWVCYCDIPKGKDKCTTCTSLSSRTRLLPPLYSRMKYMRVTHQDIDVNNDTHIIIMVPAGEKTVNIVSDRYDSNERHLIYQMPNTYDTIISYPVSVTDGAAMLKISNASSFYSLHLSGLNLPINAYTAMVIPQGCRKHSAEYYEGSVLRMHVPWSNEDTYTFASYGKQVSLPIKLQTMRPADYDFRLDASEPHLEMFLHPFCHYQLRLFIATQDMLGQAARFYALLLPGYFVAVLLMTLAGVVKAHSKGQVVSSDSPADVLFDCAKPFYLVSVVVVVSYLMRFAVFAKLLRKMGFPEDDGTSLRAEGIYFNTLPLMLYITAWMTTYLQSFVMYHVLKALSNLGRLVALLPESVARITPTLQLIVSCVAMVMTFLCGTLGLLVTSALLILKVLHLVYIVGIKQDTRNTHQSLVFFFPLALLVNWQVLLSLGPFVIWLKNVLITKSWFHHLSPDPSWMPAFIVCACVMLLLYKNDASPPQSGVAFGWLIHALAVVVILYGQESLYRLPTFICLTVLTVTLPRVLGIVLDRTHKERRKSE